ncbi:unnamed protein product [Rotaria sp. Silwood1]|nr:unnamed protein product [Rotaria sp. Silwood1]CAF1219544.1 unnamed protein product [Rotaria sp. Silwood1]CAF1222765.1 unnamed protein product [Rotaria sp. Silwood1]CAF3483389.1 unnamed protein product [Rotaria sp. Silwood1]CAF3492540.1 unnamed protein product [Rotaria sp. Silwood1]
MSLFDRHQEDTDEEENNVNEQEQTDNEDIAFIAKLKSSRTLASILKTIHFADDAIFCALPTGIKIIVEDKQCVQGNAFIDTRVFDSYELMRQVRFRFHLETVLNCLNIFGIPLDPVTHEPLPTNVAVQIHYRENQTHPLQLYLEEEGVITECLIKVLDDTDTIDFDFQTENVVTKVVFKASGFKEALSEIDLKADCIELFITQDVPHFRLIANGCGGSTSVDINQDSPVMDTFLCTEPVHNRKLSLRIDAAGILCAQFLIYTEKDKPSLVEYFFGPDEELNEHEENTQSSDVVLIED